MIIASTWARNALRPALLVVRAAGWAQKFAALNRDLMMRREIEAAKAVIHKNF